MFSESSSYYEKRAETKVPNAPADPWQHRSAGMRCLTCIYFVPKHVETSDAPTVNGRLGRCRRHAPALNGFPAVFERDWCGDHRLDEYKV